MLTPDDLRMLIESEDEFNRRGHFQRVFPSNNTKKYLKFFETTRYYNLLLAEWISKYRNNRDKAISILNHYCKKKIHFQNPTDNPEHQWSQNKIVVNRLTQNTDSLYVLYMF